MRMSGPGAVAAARGTFRFTSDERGPSVHRMGPNLEHRIKWPRVTTDKLN